MRDMQGLDPDRANRTLSERARNEGNDRHCDDRIETHAASAAYRRDAYFPFVRFT
jgi:hypothetical protein